MLAFALPDSLAFRRARSDSTAAAAAPLLHIADQDQKTGRNGSVPEIPPQGGTGRGGSCCGSLWQGVVFFFTGTALLLYRTLKESRRHFVVIAGFGALAGPHFHCLSLASGHTHTRARAPLSLSLSLSLHFRSFSVQLQRARWAPSLASRTAR